MHCVMQLDAVLSLWSPEIVTARKTNVARVPVWTWRYTLLRPSLRRYTEYEPLVQGGEGDGGGEGGMFGDTLQTQATHSHSHTHAVHPSTYRADSGAITASRREGRCRLGHPPAGGGGGERPKSTYTASVHGRRMHLGSRWRKDSLSAAPAPHPTPAGRHTFRRMSLAILKCGAALAARTKNYHRRSGDAEEQMEKSISSPPPPNYSVGSGLAENVPGKSEMLRT